MEDWKRAPNLSAAKWSADVTARGVRDEPPPPPPETELDRMIRRMIDGVNACHQAKAYVPCATLIFTYIETLGGFLIGSERESGDGRTRFKAFLARYFKTLLERIKYAAENVKKDPADYPDILYDKFRCGLVHEYIMKDGVALRRTDTEMFTHSPYVEITPEYELILNIDDLRTEFCTEALMFKEDAQNNSEIRANFELRMKYLSQRGNKKKGDQK